MAMWDIQKVIARMLISGFLGVGLVFSGPITADVLRYSLQDLHGNTQSLSRYRDRWVIVNFWATWCGPCIREIPELMAFADRHPEQVQLVGIAFEKTPVDEIRAFVAEFGVSYPVLIIGQEPLVPMEPLKGLPSTFLISPKGQVVDSHVGPVTADQLTHWLTQHAKGETN